MTDSRSIENADRQESLENAPVAIDDISETVSSSAPPVESPATTPDQEPVESAADVARRVETLIEKVVEPAPQDALEESSRELGLAQLRLGYRHASQRQWLRQSVILVATALTTLYIVYRAGWTMNLDGPYATFVSVALLAAEIYASGILFLYFFQVWRLREPPIVAPSANRTIDVLVPTYNEDVSLLRGTLEACVAMDYPHETYVLDDGDRAEVRELAESLGVRYIAREGNKHAKAGNLNNALEQTKGDFVVILDADHVPLRHFLTRTIGYFDDPKLAFVQAPHTTYNLDNFLGRWKAERRVYWEDVHLFFEAVQLGKNYWNAATFCGSAAIFRRAALDSVGGLATETNTEDLHTGLRIHAKGWKSLAISEQLVAGLAPEDVATFNTQRLRWGEGNLSVMAYDNPLTTRGLSFAQRLNYLASMLNWTFGVPRMIMYLTPISMLFAGVAPVGGADLLYFIITGAYLTSVWAAVKISSNGCGHLFNIEVAMMASFFVQVRAVFRAMFLRRWQRFVVTKKRGGGKQSILRQIAPQIAIGSLGLAALTWAALKTAFGVSNDYLGLTIGGILVLYHAVLALAIISRSIRSKNKRSQWRHPAKLIADVVFTGATDRIGGERAVTLDFCEGGCSLLTRDKIPVDTQLAVRLHSPIQTVRCTGRVRAARPVRPNKRAKTFGWLHNIQFTDLDDRQIGGLWTIALQYIVPRLSSRHARGFSRWTHVIRRLLNRLPLIGRHEFGLPLPVEAAAPDEKLPLQASVVDRIQRDGLIVTLDHLLAEGTTSRLRLHRPEGPLEFAATVASVDTSRAGAAIVHRHVFRTEDAAARDALRRLIDDARRNRWPKAIERLEPRPQTTIRKSDAAAIFVAVSVALATTVTAFFGQYRKDLVLLEASGASLTQSEAETIAEIAEQSAAGGFSSTDRLLRSYDAAVTLGDNALAADIAVRLAERIPKSSVEWRLTAARHFAQTEQHAKAYAIFRDLLNGGKALRYSPEQRADIFVEGARAALAVDEKSRASEWFARAMDLASTDPAWLAEFTGLLVATGQVDYAIRLLDQLDPTADVIRLQADLYEMADRPEEAIPLLEELLSIDKNDEDVLRRLAEHCFKTGDDDRTIECYEALAVLKSKVVDVDKKLVEALLQKARHEAKLGDFDRSIPAFERVLATDPTDGIRREAAGVMATAGRTDQALDLLRNLDDVDSLKLTASLLESRKQYHEATRILERLINRVGPTPDLRRRLAGALEAEGSYDTAYDILQGLQEEGLGEPADEMRIARLLLAIGRYDEAAAAYRSLVEATPNDSTLSRQYIMAAAAAKQLTEDDRRLVDTLFDASRAKDFLDFDQELFARFGDVLRKLGRLDAAVVALSTAVDRFPNAREMRLRLAQTLQQQGRYDEAESHFERLLGSAAAR